MSGGGGGGGGGGDGAGLSKLGTALIVIFVISLVALLAELFYVMWRRRVFRRRFSTVGGGGGGDQLSQYSSSDSTSSIMVSSKELLYFLCIRSPPRFEHNSIVANTAATDRNSNRSPEMEVIDIDLMKIQGMFGPPRFLFTIKEEEKEGFESPAEKSGVSRRSLEECFKAAAVAINVDSGGRGQDATPFSTPCASPVYFTPSASPVHELVSAESKEESRISSGSKPMASLRPEV